MAKENDVIELVTDSHGVKAVFYCPGCEREHAVYVSGMGVSVWDWNRSYLKPTFNPSVLTKIGKGEAESVCHAVVEDGSIRFLKETTHRLKNKKLSLMAEEIKTT